MARIAIHPGEHLAEELDALTLSAADLARRLTVPTNRVTEILNGRRAITGTPRCAWRISTMIEGNRLTQEQVAHVIGRDQYFPGRERDQDEVKGWINPRCSAPWTPSNAGP